MGLFDKLKNVFFEEDDEVDDNVQELAKKVEIPKPKINKVEVASQIKEEPAKVIVPKVVVSKSEQTVPDDTEEFGIASTQTNNSKIPMMFEEDDFLEENTVYKSEPPKVTRESNKEKNETPYYSTTTKKTSLYSSSNNNYDYSKKVYEEKETKTFKPSPIISPIYGILDKNYTKEEVVTKKEIKITSNRKADLDTARSKVLGESVSNNVDASKKEVKREREESFYNVNTSKPAVERVTLADADEYYNDLGLAYNVDYNDKSHNNSSQKVTKDKEGKLEDNLFDLIESMYDKED